MDSRPDTHEHIAQVRGLLLGTVTELLRRAHRHDRSKLAPPEVEAFDVHSPALRETTYGSDEYHRHIHEMDDALAHHYAHNRHHPEFHEGGVADMDLVDLIEMLCDWVAATRRHPDGDVRQSIDHNRTRFAYGDEIARLLHNTAARLESLEMEL